MVRRSLACVVCGVRPDWVGVILAFARGDAERRLAYICSRECTGNLNTTNFPNADRSAFPAAFLVTGDRWTTSQAVFDRLPINRVILP
jgi:hypothetical protein